MRDAELAKAAGLVAAPDARACAMCHDDSTPSMRPFDPATAMQAIDHWSKERASRTAKTGAHCPRHDAPSTRFAERDLPTETFLGHALTAHPAGPERASAVAKHRAKAATAGRGAPKARPD
jgi:hypothetical protein